MFATQLEQMQGKPNAQVLMQMGGVLLTMDAAPALTKGIASIEPASRAESPTTARSLLLEPGVGGKMVQATAR